ncbi:Glycosyltransferase 14 family member [Fasciola hepatica]|uniref:Glycosyltransferase 14 family member n=1 Tax=Fasciola hepatica TaxID=6192 RepID=A0A2H1CR03_FASHE|nr:Glycosyltransferase 14 family member [Fasciola hepatica]
MVAVFWYNTNSLVLRHTIFYAFIIFLLYMIAFYVPLRRIHKPKNELADYQVLTDTGTLWLPKSLTQTEVICPILISPKLNEQFADTLTKITRTDQTNINPNQIDDCPQFKQIHGDQPSVSDEELQFPLAFSFNVHKQFTQFARLFRAVFRHHNAYCIHVDYKADREFRKQVMRLVNCFGPNVYVIPRERSISVKWGDLSTLEAWIRCAEFLLNQSSVRWKYLLNGSGQEFPLRTNWELVRALKAINGSNIVESNGPNTDVDWVPNKSFSFNFTWFNGSFYTALRKEMIQFALRNKYATEILTALRREDHRPKFQHELFFSTLNYNSQFNAPGACAEVHRQTQSDPLSTFVARYAVWLPQPCLSERSQRNVCIMGVRNIPTLTNRYEFFVNKFIYDFQPLAYDCLEWWLFRKIQYERNSGHTASSFDPSFYANLYCSKNHL